MSAAGSEQCATSNIALPVDSRPTDTVMCTVATTIYVCIFVSTLYMYIGTCILQCCSMNAETSACVEMSANRWS